PAEFGAPARCEPPPPHANGRPPGGVVNARPEGAVAVAHQHADGATGEVRRGQVGDAVAVEIPHRHGDGPTPGVEAEGGDEAGQGTFFERLKEQLCVRGAASEAAGSGARTVEVQVAEE